MSKKIVEQVAEMGRNKLLRKRTLEDTDPHTILVITWHPKLNAIPSILRTNSI